MFAAVAFGFPRPLVGIGEGGVDLVGHGEWFGEASAVRACRGVDRGVVTAVAV